MTYDRNPNTPIANLAIGKIIEVDGSHIVAELDSDIQELSRIFGGETYPIGQFGSIVKIHFGRHIIYGYVGRLRMKSEYEKEMGVTPPTSSDSRIIEADLFGEGEWTLNTELTSPKWELHFERGVSTFPLPQQTLYLTPLSELRFIYGHGKGATINIGEHVGSGGTPCYADMNELLGKHTAILGSTGAGKSGAVAAILHSLLERGSKMDNLMPRIIILDPHNEYGAAFPEHKRLSTEEGSLFLPYWLLNLQETISLVIGKTEFVATSQSNIVKVALLKARTTAATEIGIDATKLTVDSPTPYCLDEFKEAIGEQRPSGKNKKEQEPFNSVINKLEVLQRDARVGFLMSPWDSTSDPFPNVISQFIGDGEPVRIVDLSGVPNEVAGVTSATIARTLFNFKLWQTSEERESDPTLLVCEEAHRYVPNRGEAQYEAAQEAIRRIAKEGRKYGLGLILVSQRPSEVEATVLSQCNTWIVLRITNDTDREHVRSILPDSLTGLTKVLSGLRRQEAIFTGQAAMLPSRILIRSLEREQLPRSHDIDFDKGWQTEPMTSEKISEIATRWRLQQKPTVE
ncbi:MAG: DNA helicase [Candidatus Methanogaster sp.]|uniref:DNA helicase n=1 Tax=Candidatus Methanogaster sp. TaxID=3386292 RepID=A0AC61L1J4_9EURY|nr:MAG: DNA helicase [ANME-2 cluster archaeon]